MKRYYIIFIGLLLVLTDAPAQAQNTPAAAITPGQQKAAEALLQSAGMEKNLVAVIDQVITTQIQQNPSLKVLEPEMRAFLAKYMSWNAVKEEMTQVYAREFTEKEMQEITKFYQTPAGQKLNFKLPALTKAGMELGQRRVQEHLPEFESIVKAKLEAQEK